MDYDIWFSIYCLGFRVLGFSLLGLMVYQGLEVQSLGFRVQAVGFTDQRFLLRISILGFMLLGIQVSVFKVHGLQVNGLWYRVKGCGTVCCGSGFAFQGLDYTVQVLSCQGVGFMFFGFMILGFSVLRFCLQGFHLRVQVLWFQEFRVQRSRFIILWL